MDEPHANHSDNNLNKSKLNSSFKLSRLKKIFKYVNVPDLLDPLSSDNESEKDESYIRKSPLSIPSFSFLDLNLPSFLNEKDQDEEINFQNNNFKNNLTILNIKEPRIKKEGFKSKWAKCDSDDYQFSPQTTRLFKMVTKISRNETSQNLTKSNLQFYKSNSLQSSSTDQLSSCSSTISSRCSSRSSNYSSNLSSLSPLPSPASSQSSFEDIIFHQNYDSKQLPNIDKILRYYRQQFYLTMKPMNKFDLTFRNYPSYLSSCKKNNFNESQISLDSQASQNMLNEARKEIEQLLVSFQKESQLLSKEVDENGHLFFSIPKDIQELIS